MDYPNVISAPFRVYDNTRFYSLAHDIEELANGNILVTWEAINRVFGEIYTPDGTVVQRDFVIARSTLESVSVTATEDGGFFAVREEEQSSGLIDVKGQFFDDLGREFGAERMVRSLLLNLPYTQLRMIPGLSTTSSSSTRSHLWITGALH